MHQQGKIVNKCRDAGTQKCISKVKLLTSAVTRAPKKASARQKKLFFYPTLLVKPCGRVPLSILLDSANYTIFYALFANPHFKGFCAFALSLWFRAKGQKNNDRCPPLFKLTNTPVLSVSFRDALFTLDRLGKRQTVCGVNKINLYV